MQKQAYTAQTPPKIQDFILNPLERLYFSLRYGKDAFKAVVEAIVRNMVEWIPVRSPNSGANIIIMSTNNAPAVKIKI